MIRLLLLLVLNIATFGQSAYYRLGYGDVFPTVGAFESSVGEGVVAWQDTTRFSNSNPAALPGLKQVYFGGSLGSKFKSVSANVTNTTRLDQVGIAFPVGAKAGLSLGVGAITDLETIYEFILAAGTLQEDTQGGIWDYQLGLGYGITPTLSLGLKFHLLQGAIRRQTTFRSDDINELYVIKGNISGKSLELGLLTQLGDNVTLGLTAKYPYRRPTLDGRDSLAGTETYIEIDEELKAWPTTYKLGLVYHRSKHTKFVVGIEQQLFSETGFDESRIFTLPQGWQTMPVASLQVSMVRLAADPISRSWFKRVGWQTGLSVKNYYLASSADQLISEMALISGLNLGLRNGRSIFDISGEFGTRSGEESLPEELFARIKFGIQVNDTWFRKVKRR